MVRVADRSEMVFVLRRLGVCRIPTVQHPSEPRLLALELDMLGVAGLWIVTPA